MTFKTMGDRPKEKLRGRDRRSLIDEAHSDRGEGHRRRCNARRQNAERMGT